MIDVTLYLGSLSKAYSVDVPLPFVCCMRFPTASYEYSAMVLDPLFTFLQPGRSHLKPVCFDWRSSVIDNSNGPAIGPLPSSIFLRWFQSTDRDQVA